MKVLLSIMIALSTSLPASATMTDVPELRGSTELASSSGAEPCKEINVIQTQLPGVIELSDSKRLGWKHREHFWQVRGAKEYTYKTADGKLITSAFHDRAVPDKRTFEKRHPYLSGVSTLGGLVGLGVNAASIITR